MIDFVYFVKAPTRGIKIGFSADPRKRIKSLQTANSDFLETLAIVSVPSRRIEADLHLAFKAHRKIGEWFKSNDYMFCAASVAKELGTISDAKIFKIAVDSRYKLLLNQKETFSDLQRKEREKKFSDNSLPEMMLTIMNAASFAYAQRGASERFTRQRLNEIIRLIIVSKAFTSEQAIAICRAGYNLLANTNLSSDEFSSFLNGELSLHGDQGYFNGIVQ